MKSRIPKLLLYAVIGVFALIGATTTAVFIAMQYGLLNVRGSIAERNAFFGLIPGTATTGGSIVDLGKETNGCRPPSSQTEPCEWNETIYWDAVKGGLLKDVEVITRVSQETGVPARMIVSTVVPEQTRFFTDNRDVFKRYFEPLKLLGSMSQFSLGVTGIKQTTAELIELYASSTTSPFYPGNDIAPLLAYQPDEDPARETALFNRLTDEKDHYYSYLYTAIYLKEITKQWERAGYDIRERPDVLVTLFNIGFSSSQPKANPQVAGSSVVTGGQTYSFGYLGKLFYDSNELIEEFPRTL